MSLLTYLDPNAIKDASIEGIKIKDGAISSSKIDGTVASKSYVDALEAKVTNAVKVTYTELKSLRDAGKLVAGTQYRITDYTCTTIQENTKSAGHVFDIIVTADDESTLNEEARAVKHEEDTYFANSNLSAWKIWYCLDNDTTKFAWATNEELIGTIRPTSGSASGTYTYTRPISKIMIKETIYVLEIGVRTKIYSGPPVYITKTDDYTLVLEDEYNLIKNTSGVLVYIKGQGVIYRMIDEWNNDVPYDFKNIQFKHLNDYYYTFASSNVEDNTDYSLNISNKCYSNVIKEYVKSNKRTLNQIIFIGSDCYSNTFGNDCNHNTFGNNCSNNTFGNYCGYNTFGNNCSNNTFGNECYINTFGNNCSNNTFGNYCGYIKFASDSSVSTKYNYYQNNHIGDNCACILFKGTETASDSAQVQNYNFAQGLQGTEASYLTIDGKRNRDYETYISKDTDGTIKESVIAEKIDKIIEISYADLVTLRGSSKLVPGQQYRITDYTCTATQANTKSAGHVFDIIVTADDESTLNEEARAVKHEGDTYFANNDLNAWKIWYCLDNDTARFAWADTTNGKGVIYRMIDEFNNDVPYDFKNIQFKRYAVTDVTSKELTRNALNNLKNTFIYIEKEQPIHFSFSSSNINNDSSTLVIDNNNYGWYYTFSTIKYDSKEGYSSVIEDASVIGVNFYNDEDRGGCFNNKIEVFRDFTASENDGLDGCCRLNNIVFNGRYEQDGFAFNACSNHIKSQSRVNTFGCGCCNNTFGNNCISNTFGKGCSQNTFGNWCWDNTFGSECYYNTCGHDFKRSTFGDGCCNNTFGNNCNGNTFGINFWFNTFGNECWYSTFGDSCTYNTFGNNCHSNKFGYGCDSNTFGNECWNIKFASNSSASTAYNFYQHNHFGDGCQYIVFRGASTASSSSQIQNYNFAQGLQGTEASYLTIDGVRNLAYETKVAKNSTGEIKIYCEADLIL